MVIVKSTKTPYQMELSNGVATVMGDVPKANGGQGEYFSPFEFLRSALGACLNVTTRAILDKRGIEYKGVEVKVDLDQSKEGKLIFKHAITIDAPISDADKAKYAKMAFAGCHIHKALEGDISFEEM